MRRVLKYQRSCLFVFLLVVQSLFPAFAQQPAKKAQEAEESVAEAVSSRDLELIDFANGLFERNFYDMALQEYKKFIVAFPESDFLEDAYYGVAESLFFLKSYVRAIGALNSYKEFYPSGAKIDIVNLRLGQSFFFLEEYEEALSRLTEVDPGRLDKEFLPGFYLYQGKVLSQRGSLKEAEKALLQAAEQSSEKDMTFSVFMELADVFDRREDFLKAIAYYRKAREAADSDARKGITLYKEGEVYLFIKRYKEAITAFENIVTQYAQQDVAFDALVNLMLAYYRAGEHEKVLEVYDQRKADIQKQDTDEVFRVYYLLALAHIRASEFEKALTALDTVLKREGLSEQDKGKAYIKKLEILVKLRNFEEALTIVKAHLKDVVEDRDNILFLKAEAFYGLKRYQEAFAVYQEIQTQYKDSGLSDEVLYSMAHAKSKSQEPAEAAKLFWRYFQQGKDSPKREEALYNLILIEKDLEQWEQAIKHAEIFLKTFPKSETKEKVFYWLGTLYPKNDQISEAIAVYKEFLTSFPESEQSHEICFLLAFHLNALGSSDEALSYYERLDSPDVHRALRYPALKNAALIYLNRQEQARAAALFYQLITLYDDNDLKWETYIWLAERYLKTGQYADMLKVVEKAGAKLDKDEEKRHWELIFLEAQALRKLEKYEKAIENYQKLLAHPDAERFKAASRIGLGLCYAQTAQYEKAKEQFETAILENTEDNTVTMRARFEIANVYRELDDHEQAVKFYMFVSVLYDDDEYCPEALYQAGRSFEMLKQGRKAVQVYQELGARYPDSPQAQQAKERIESLNENET